MEKKNKYEIPNIGERTRKLWRNTTIRWLVAYYAVNILAFGASILVILLECASTEKDMCVILLSAISAVLTFVSFVINFKQQIPRYRKAFNVLNAAMLDYYAHPDKPEKIDKIVMAITKGEDMIDNSYEVENSNNDNHHKEA